jgi:hypothetical protein
MVAPVQWICNALIVNQPNGYTEMGIYSACLSFQSILLFLTRMLGAPLTPMLANMAHTPNDKLGRINMVSTWALGTVGALPLLCLPEVAELLYGRQFSGPTFRLTLVLTMFCTCVVIYKQGLARVLLAHSLMWWSLLSNGFWALVLVVSVYLLARWGAVGLSLSLSIAYVVNTIVFVPLYTSRGLVPRNTIVSKEAATTWLILIAMVLLSYLHASLTIRLVVLSVGGLLIGFSFLRVVRCTTSEGTD